METRLKSLEFAFRYDRCHSGHPHSVDELINVAEKFYNYLNQSTGEEYYK